MVGSCAIYTGGKTEKIYFVFIKMHHLHPFSMRDQSLMNNGNGENDKENEKDKIKKNVFI